MKNIFRNRYRIVFDCYGAGFDPEVRYWFLPFYIKIAPFKWIATEEYAMKIIERHRYRKYIPVD